MPGGGPKKKKVDQLANKLMKANKNEISNSEKQLKSTADTHLLGMENNVKDEHESNFDKFFKSIRSKLGDLEDEDDPDNNEIHKGDISPEQTDFPRQFPHKDFSKSKGLVSDVTVELEREIRRRFIKDIEEMKTLVSLNLRKKGLEIQNLKEKIEQCENEKASVSIKYKKYKDMAIKLSKGSANKDLEDENTELKLKLKGVLDELGNSEESKSDVNSKLKLKEMMLKEQVRKNEDLEAKIKKFVTKFFENMDKDPHKGTASNLSQSMDESQITTYLKSTNKSLHQEISSKFASVGATRKMSKSVEVGEPPKMKVVEVKLQNVGVENKSRDHAVSDSKIERTKKRKLSIDSLEMTKEKSSLSFSILENSQVDNVSSIGKLINETQIIDRKSTKHLDEENADDKVGQIRTKKSRKSQNRKLSEEISNKRYEIKSLSNTVTAPVKDNKGIGLNRGLDLLPSDDVLDVPPRVKSANKSGENVDETEGDDFRQRTGTMRSQNSNRSKYTKKPTGISEVSSHQIEMTDLPAKLSSNSRISIGKTSTSKSENKVQNSPVTTALNLPGISVSKQSSSLSVTDSSDKSKMTGPGVANLNLPGLSFSKSSTLSLDNDSEQRVMKKDRETAETELNLPGISVSTSSHSKDYKQRSKKTVMGTTDTEMNLPGISLSKSSSIKTRESPKALKRKRADGSEFLTSLSGISFSKSSDSSGSRQEQAMEKSNTDGFNSTSEISLKKLDNTVDSRLRGSNISISKSTVVATQGKKKRKSFANDGASPDMLQIAERPNTEATASSIKENLALRSLNLSITKSDVENDSRKWSSPSHNSIETQKEISQESASSTSSTGTDINTSTNVEIFQNSKSITINSSVGSFRVDADAPIADTKVRMEEGKMVQLSSDVLKDMEHLETMGINVEEEIPWEATDSQIVNTNVNNDVPYALQDESYNSLMSKIDSELEDVSKKNQQTKKQIESEKLNLQNRDDELEKLLID